MKNFYVSLVGDLLGAFLVFEAESETAVHQYLEREYLREGTWTLPWCSVYAEPPADSVFSGPPILIQAQCGSLYERHEKVTAIGARP